MHGLLDQTVNSSRDAQLTHPASGFGNFYPQHRLRLILTRQQSLFDCGPMAYQVATQVFHAQTIHARNTLIAHDALQRPLHVLTFDHCFHQVAPFLIEGAHRCPHV